MVEAIAEVEVEAAVDGESDGTATITAITVVITPPTGMTPEAKKMTTMALVGGRALRLYQRLTRRSDIELSYITHAACHSVDCQVYTDVS